MKHKLQSLIPALALLILLFSQLSVPAKAEGHTEADTAAALALNTEEAGKLTKSASRQWYRFRIYENGYFTVSFQLSAEQVPASLQGFRVTVLNASLEQVYQNKTSASFTSYRLPFAPGEYYLKVEPESAYESFAPYDIPYGIRVDYTAANDWESEPNDNDKNAVPIYSGASSNGNLNSNSDVDYFKFELTENGSFSLDFDVRSEQPKYGWSITLLDDRLTTLYEAKQVKKSAVLPSFGFAKGTYYVKIEAGWNFSDNVPVGDDYRLTLHFTKDASWEAESNDTMETAKSIRMNAAYTGTLLRADDKDYYKFSVSGPQKVRLHLDFICENPESGYTLRIVNAKGTEVFSAKQQKKPGYTDAVTLAKGTYYAVVEAGWNFSNYMPLHVPYQLKIVPYETEKNNTATKSNRITLAKYGAGKYIGSIYGNLSSKADTDCYRFTVNGSYTGTLSLTGASKAFRVTVYDAKGNSVAVFTPAKKATDKTVSLKKGTYTVKVERNAGNYSSKAYRLTVKAVAR